MNWLEKNEKEKKLIEREVSLYRARREMDVENRLQVQKEEIAKFNAEINALAEKKENKLTEIALLEANNANVITAKDLIIAEKDATIIKLEAMNKFLATKITTVDLDKIKIHVEKDGVQIVK
jgi:hypothetical protein